MALSMQSKCISARSTVSKASPRCVRVEAAHGVVERVQLAAASLAAVALLMAPMAPVAEAGVILTKPSRSYKAFQSSDKPSEPQAAPSVSPPKSEGPKFGPIGFEVQSLGFPGAIGFIGALVLLAYKVDDEFGDFMKSVIIKDSNLGEAGLGYEEVIKSTYGGIYGEATATKKGKAGKKKGLFPFGKK